jgi:hypothetical protein
MASACCLCLCLLACDNDCEVNLRKTNLVQGALGGGLSDVDDLDLEVAVVTRGATRGSRRAGLDVVGDTLSDGRGNDSGRKGDRGSDGVAHVGGC